MYIILGGTGHVGSAVAQALLHARQLVTVVTHQPGHADHLRQQGAHVAVADAHDQAALHGIFQTGQRLFLLNPPADPATDTVAEEKQTLRTILAALPGTPIRKIVAESTYGAQPGEGHGDLNVLYDMEQALKQLDASVSIIRAAYYMSNWVPYLPAVRERGTLPSLYPADFQLPMVAPADLGRVAARLLQEPLGQTGLHYVEGPATYSPADVAAAFAQALGRPVRVAVTPRSEWEASFRAASFSTKAAASFTAMTALTLNNTKHPAHPERGVTTIQQYINELVKSPPH